MKINLMDFKSINVSVSGDKAAIYLILKVVVDKNLPSKA
jgi:hypothetical protein